MDFVIKCLFLGGQYATQAAGEVIVTIIKGGINLHKNLTQKYKSIVRIIDSHENMLEHLNAFTQSTNHGKVEHPHLTNENRNVESFCNETTRARSDFLNKLHSSWNLQKPPISKCNILENNVDNVKNQNLASLNNDGIHDHEEIYSDHYKYLYKNFRGAEGTSAKKEQNLSGTAKTREYDYNSHNNITFPKDLHKPMQHERTDLRKFMKKSLSQPNILTSSVQFLSYEMLSLQSKGKETVNKLSNSESSDNEKLLKKKIDHLESPTPDRFFDYEANKKKFKSSASTSDELKKPSEDVLKQSILEDKKPIEMEETFSQFSENNGTTKNATRCSSIQLNIPCILENIPELRMLTIGTERVHIEEKKMPVTNENESDLKMTSTIKNETEDVTETLELATVREPISTITKCEDPIQLEASLAISNINESSTSVNKKIICQTTNYNNTKNLNEEPIRIQKPPLQNLPKPEFLPICNDDSSVLKAAKATTHIEENTVFDGLSPSLEKDEKNPPKPLQLNETADQTSLKNNKNDETSFTKITADFSVHNSFISAEKNDMSKEDFRKLDKEQQICNCVLTSVTTEIQETGKVNKEDDNILQIMSNEEQRRNKNNHTVDNLQKPHVFCDDFFSNDSEKNLDMNIRNTKNTRNKQTSYLQSDKDEFNLDYSDDTYTLPDISNTRFPINNEKQFGKAITLTEDEETAQSVENSQTFSNVMQQQTPVLEDKKTEVSKASQVTYMTKPHSFNYEILSTNKKENDSKSNSSTESKNQTRELHDTSYIIQKGKTHSNLHQLMKLQRHASKSSTVKEFRIGKTGNVHESVTNEFLYTIFEHFKKPNNILNEKYLPKYQLLHFTRLNQIVSKQVLEQTHGNTEINILSNPPKYNEFLTNYTNFLLRCKSNNFLRDYFTKCTHTNPLQSSVLFHTTFARAMKENLVKERQGMSSDNENQLLKEFHEYNKQEASVVVPGISAESNKYIKLTKFSTPNIFSTEKERVTFSLYQYQNNKLEKSLSIKTQTFELRKKIASKKCTEIHHMPIDKSECKTLKLSTSHETCPPKFSDNQHQLVTRNKEKWHKKSVERQHHTRQTVQTCMRKETSPNLENVLLQVDFKINNHKKFMLSQFERTKEIKKLLSPYLKNEIRVLIVNQKAFYKLEQKVTQYLIRQNMRLQDKNKFVKEISLERIFKRGFSKSLPTEEQPKLPKSDDKPSENCDEEAKDDKLIGKSILYIFFIAFLNFASDQEFPLFP